MKIWLTAIIYLFFVLSLRSVNAQWKSVNPGNYTWIQANAIDACDSATAVISVYGGYSIGGVLLLTTDAGKTWQNLNWPKVEQSSSVIDVSIIDELHIWAAIDDGRIISTNDGGKLWQVQFNDKSKTDFMDYIEMFNNNEGVALGDALSYDRINDIFFINENLGWAVGNYFWKTTNGGNTWTEEIKVSPEFVCNNIFFVDQNNGWMNGNYAQGFYRTTNGGLKWDSLRIAFSPSISGITFLNDKDGWVLSNSVLTKTSDGGLSWSTVSTNNWKTVNCISFISKDIGWISGKVSSLTSDPYTLIKTNDGGNTFQVVKSFTNETISFIYFMDEITGWVVTRRASGGTKEEYLYKTSDGGSNWTVSKIGTTAITKFSIFPYTALEGKKNYFIIGSWYGGIIKSSDNGETWSTFNTSFIQNATFFVNDEITYAGSSDQTIYKTTDGGTTWKKMFEKVPEPLVLLSTTDGGSNWIQPNNLPLGWISGDTWRRVDFINRDKGFFFPGSNYKSYIIPPDHNYKTLNGGSDWIRTNIPALTLSLKFFDENYGMILGRSFPTNNLYLYRTKNGGVSYDSTYLSASDWGYDIEFLPGESSKVWLSRTSGLYYSPDSGKTWVNGNLFTGSASSVIDIVFIDKRIGWVLCNNSGAVYRTENNAGLATDVSTNDVIPIKFFLSQNYPNPFNPSTVISYQLPVAGNVSLKIFDILGREVATLVNDYKQPGIYEVKFDTRYFELVRQSRACREISSGIYFYSLKAGNYFETKKMVLMK